MFPARAKKKFIFVSICCFDFILISEKCRKSLFGFLVVFQHFQAFFYYPKYYKPAHSGHFVRHRVQRLIDPMKVSLSANRVAAPQATIDRRPAGSKVVVGVEALRSLQQRAPLAWLEVFIKMGAFPEDQKTTNKQQTTNNDEGAPPPFLVSLYLRAFCVNLVTNAPQC